MNSCDECLDQFDRERHRFQLFADSVAQFFLSNPALSSGVVHSVKVRLKGRSNLAGKIRRKHLRGVVVEKENLFEKVTDLAGVRVFHLHNAQFPLIHREIIAQVQRGDWTLGEKPKAFSWDPEASAFYTELGFEPEIRSTFYTSIHYLLRPSSTSDICCEVQVRTLFEEVWGEIDHLLNYPAATLSVACREQLRALSKLVGTGSRLVDSIVRSSEEFDGFNNFGKGADVGVSAVEHAAPPLDAVESGRKIAAADQRKGSAKKAMTKKSTQSEIYVKTAKAPKIAKSAKAAKEEKATKSVRATRGAKIGKAAKAVKKLNSRNS